MWNRHLFLACLHAATTPLTLPVRSSAQDNLPAAGRTWALVGGTVYTSPAEPPVKDGVIVVRGGRITAVGQKSSVQFPPNIEKLDCSGLTITAGFWNSHVHFVQREWDNVQAIPAVELSEQMEDMFPRWGFASVFDIGSRQRFTTSPVVRRNHNLP